MVACRKMFVRVNKVDGFPDEGGKGGWWTVQPGVPDEGRPGRKSKGKKGCKGEMDGDEEYGDGDEGYQDEKGGAGYEVDGIAEDMEAR
jgi:hypothetical protein